MLQKRILRNPLIGMGTGFCALYATLFAENSGGARGLPTILCIIVWHTHLWRSFMGDQAVANKQWRP